MCNVSVCSILKHVYSVFVYMSQSLSDGTSITCSELFTTVHQRNTKTHIIPGRRGMETGWIEKVAAERSLFKVVLYLRKWIS